MFIAEIAGGAVAIWSLATALVYHDFTRGLEKFGGNSSDADRCRENKKRFLKVFAGSMAILVGLIALSHLC